MSRRAPISRRSPSVCLKLYLDSILMLMPICCASTTSLHSFCVPHLIALAATHRSRPVESLASISSVAKSRSVVEILTWQSATGLDQFHRRGSQDSSARPQTYHFCPFCRIRGRRSGPRGLEMAAACLRVDSQDLVTILDPFRSISIDLEPDRLSAT